MIYESTHLQKNYTTTEKIKPCSTSPYFLLLHLSTQCRSVLCRHFAKVWTLGWRPSSRYETSHQHTRAFKLGWAGNLRWAEGPHLHSWARLYWCHVEPAYCVQMGMCTCTVLRLKHGLYTDGWIPWMRRQGQTCLSYWLKHLSQDLVEKRKTKAFFLILIGSHVGYETYSGSICCREFSLYSMRTVEGKKNLPLTTIMAP